MNTSLTRDRKIGGNTTIATVILIARARPVAESDWNPLNGIGSTQNDRLRVLLFAPWRSCVAIIVEPILSGYGCCLPAEEPQFPVRLRYRTYLSAGSFRRCRMTSNAAVKTDVYFDFT